MEFYNLEEKDIDGNIVKFEKYKNKIILIVNVASKCGYTKQYEGLEKLFKKYKDKDFLILGFPCRQFAFEEFNDESKIKEFCSTKYNVTFEMFSITSVKGKNISPLYKYLISNFKNENVKWNFEKFLINKKGEIVERFMSNFEPEEIEKFIKSEIKKD